MAERAKRVRDVEGEAGHVEIPLSEQGATNKQEAQAMTDLVVKAAETNCRVVDSLLTANREKNHLLTQTAEMAVGAQEVSYQSMLSMIQSKRMQEQAAQKSFREQAKRLQLEAEVKAQKTLAHKGKDLAIRQLEEKLKVQAIATNGVEDTNRRLHRETLGQLEQIQKQRAEHHSGAEERALRQEVDSLILERDTLKVRMNQAGDIALNHRNEVTSLLRLVEELGTKVEGHAELERSSGNLQALVRRLEAKLTPQQVMEAALPADFTAPSTFRSMGDDAPPSALRSAAPDFWAWRTLDFKQQSIGTMVGQWVDAMSDVSELRDQLAVEKEKVRKAHETNTTLIQTLHEEKYHRTSVQETLDKLNRDGLVLTEQHWAQLQGAGHRQGGDDGRCAALRNSLSQLQTQYSSVLNAKTTLVVQLESARAQLHEKSKDAEALKLKLEAASQESKPSHIAQTVAQLRLHYEQDVRRFNLQTQQVQGMLLKTQLDAKNRGKEVKDLRASLALANESVSVAVKEKQQMLEKLRVAQENQSDNRTEALTRLTASLESRRAELRSLSLKQQGAAVPSTMPPSAAVPEEAEMAQFERRVNEMSRQIHDTLKAVAESPLLSGADKAHTEMVVMRSQLTEMLSSFIHLVIAETKTTEDVRGGFLRQRILDQHLIESLKTELETTKKEQVQLAESVKSMTAMLEVASVDTTETVLMHSVPTGSIDCEKCSVMKEEVTSWETKYNESQLSLEALMQLNQRGLETQSGLRHALSNSELKTNQGQATLSRLSEQATLDQRQVSTLQRTVIQTEQALAALNVLPDDAEHDTMPVGAGEEEVPSPDGGEEATAEKEMESNTEKKNSRSPSHESVQDQLGHAVSVLTTSLDQLIAQRVAGGEGHVVAGFGERDEESVPTAVGHSSSLEGQQPVLPEKVAGIVEHLQTLWSKVQQVEAVQQHNRAAAPSAAPTAPSAAAAAAAPNQPPQAAQTGISQAVHQQQGQLLKDTQTKVGQLAHDKTNLENRLQDQKKELDQLNQTIVFVKTTVTQKEALVEQANAETLRVKAELEKAKTNNQALLKVVKDQQAAMKAPPPAPPQ